MTDYELEVYACYFPTLPVWAPGDLVRIKDGPDLVIGKLARVQSMKLRPTTYCHFNCIVETVGGPLFHCLPNDLESASVLELLADEV